MVIQKSKQVNSRSSKTLLNIIIVIIILITSLFVFGRSFDIAPRVIVDAKLKPALLLPLSAVGLLLHLIYVYVEAQQRSNVWQAACANRDA